jgi:hypothetical protein
MIHAQWVSFSCAALMSCLVQAFNLLMELFISTANEVLTISEQEINDFVEKFLASIPEIFKMTLRPHNLGT